jgi:nucleoside-diphosphate-sugar epimerase
MRILVLGGTRFVGRLLVEKLIKEHHDITILTRGNANDPFEGNVKRLICSRSDTRMMLNCLEGKEFDVIFDHICFSPDDAKIACDIFNKTAIKKYIFLSSMYVYYGQPSYLQEDDFNPHKQKLKMGSRDMLSYEDGKRMAEVCFSKNADFPIMSVRFPIIMGRDDYTGRFEYYISRILSSKNIHVPYPQGKMNYISSQDAASFLCWLKDISYDGSINAACTESYDTNELINLFSTVLGKNVIFTDVPEESDEHSYPYYRENNMVMDSTRATSMGYKFLPFNKWFPLEVNAVKKRLLEV